MKAAVLASLVLASIVAAAPSTPAKRQCSAPGSSTTQPASTSTPPTSTPPASGGGGGSGGIIKGSLFSVYADSGLDQGPPSVSAMGRWNDLILAFKLSAGPWDAAYTWSALDNSTKASTIAAYHAAGKMIRVSTFGATEYPLLSGGNPSTIAASLIQFVKDNQLDGVDVDYEDSGSFQTANGGGEQFLIDLTKLLRAGLPSPRYYITHAPQAPYFTTANNYPNGAYLKVHKEVGDLIDAYEIQFYNQGAGAYESCDGLFKTSPQFWPGTTVSEIIANGVPQSKVIIGKPGQQGDANNGLMSPSDIGSCITSHNGAVGGVMAWQWIHAGASWISAAAGNLS